MYIIELFKLCMQSVLLFIITINICNIVKQVLTHKFLGTKKRSVITWLDYGSFFFVGRLS